MDYYVVDRFWDTVGRYDTVGEAIQVAKCNPEYHVRRIDDFGHLRECAEWEDECFRDTILAAMSISMKLSQSSDV